MDTFIHLAKPETAHQLTFPGLGLEFAISREAVFIGPLTIYWYGIIVVTGIGLGVWYALWRAPQFGVDKNKLSDVLMYAIILGFVGARAYYVVFSWDYYRAHTNEILQVWRGGIAFYGGVIAALLCGYLLCRRYKISMLHATDAAIGGLLLGQSIGRWGNFVNIEAFGGYFEGPWRMVSPVIDSYFHMRPNLLPGFTTEQVLAMTEIPVHPTFFYESAWTMLGFLFMVWYTKRRRFNGELLLIYFFINGLGRSVIEGLRTDSLTVNNVRVSQVLAVMLVIASAALWFAACKMLANGSAPTWLVLRSAAATGDEALDLAADGEPFTVQEANTHDNESEDVVLVADDVEKTEEAEQNP